MLRPVADAWSMLPHPPRGVYLVLLGLAALAGVALLSLREDNAEALEEVVAVPPSRAVSAGKSLVAQGVIGPGDIRLKKCPELLPQIEEQWEHQRANAQGCRVLAEHYPGAGGAGCPCPCPKGRKMFGTAYRVEHHAGLWPWEFVKRMRRADGVMSQQGPIIKHQLNGTVNTLHMALSYHCCITKRQAAKIADVIDAFPWEKHIFTVNFSAVTCALSGPGSKTSLVLMADQESQARLGRVSEAFEDRLAAQGVHHIRHKDLQAFHITLGTLDGDLYPTQDALKAINSAVPPFSWTPSNFTVLSPFCNGCARARDKLAEKRFRR